MYRSLSFIFRITAASATFSGIGALAGGSSSDLSRFEGILAATTSTAIAFGATDVGKTGMICFIDGASATTTQVATTPTYNGNLPGSTTGAGTLRNALAALLPGSFITAGSATTEMTVIGNFSGNYYIPTPLFPFSILGLSMVGTGTASIDYRVIGIA